MRDLRAFREAVRSHRRVVGRTQQQLARAIGLHPHVLSHKLNGSDNAVLTVPDVVGVVTALASWGALVTRADADALLDLAGVPLHAVPAAAWTAPPLSALRADGELTTALPTSTTSAHAPAAAPPDQLRARRPPLALAPLPTPLTELIGRRCERAEVAAALAASRLVTLTGAGGTGKTRLALQVACDVADQFHGVAFVDLAQVRDPALLATTVAGALGLTPASADAAEADLAEALADRQLLLVLDNLEQLLDGADLLARMLSAAPALRLLATSRSPLRLYGEYTVRVPPLLVAGDGGSGTGAADSEAARLFIARAQAVRADFVPGAGDLAALGAICTALDGLPLAIELAAAQVKLYSPEALLPRLRSRLALLTGGPVDLPRRQRTLRATLEWSEALLPPTERTVFPRLGVFAGHFDATAAAVVCDGGAPAENMLQALAALDEHSLLEVMPGDPPRFRLLQTIREYALTRLAETGQAGRVRSRHLAYYLALATQARPALYGPGQTAWIVRLEADFANIRAALHWAREQAETASPPEGHHYLEQALQLATAVAPVWQDRGSLAEGALHLERLLATDSRLRAAAPATRAWALLEASGMACFRGDCPGTAALAAEGLALCQNLGDLRGQAQAHRYLGEAALTAGDHAAAEPHFTRQLALARQARDRWAEGAACDNLAQVLRYQGRYAAATTRLEQALRIFEALGDARLTATVLQSLAEVARDAGKSDRAKSLFQQALRDHQESGSKRGLVHDLEGLAGVAALEREPRAALVYLGAAQALRETTGSPQLPPEQAILTRLLGPLLPGLSERERGDALADGRNRPLADIIAEALGSSSGTSRSTI